MLRLKQSIINERQNSSENSSHDETVVPVILTNMEDVIEVSSQEMSEENVKVSQSVEERSEEDGEYTAAGQ